MNLGENLQILRKSKGMSQEELAEKLDVSRQAVSKWETGETSPETEKIILICDIFNCSMDTLVKGKITDSDNSNIKIYDDFMNKFSKGVSLGVFLILLGVTILLTIIGLVPNEENLEKYVVIGVAILLIFVVCAVPLFIVLGIKMDSIQKKYRDIIHAYNYNEEEIDKFNAKFSIVVALSVAVILIGVIVMILIYGFQLINIKSTLPVAIFMSFVTISVPFLVNAGIIKSKYDKTFYRYGNGVLDKKAEEMIGKWSAVIMLSATIIYFILGFIFNLWQYNWIVFLIGSMFCGIVSVIFYKEN